MKKIMPIVCAVIVLLTGCIPSANFYELAQDKNNISSIDLYSNETHSGSPEDHIFLTTLEQTEYEELINKITTIECSIPFDPPDCFGPYVLKIVYLDGFYELIGAENSIYYSPEGEPKHFKYYYFPDEFNALLIQYLDRSFETPE